MPRFPEPEYVRYALVGHTNSHAPHPLQRDSSTTSLPFSSIDKALYSHASTQGALHVAETPYSWHSSTSTTATPILSAKGSKDISAPVGQALTQRNSPSHMSQYPERKSICGRRTFTTPSASAPTPIAFVGQTVRHRSHRMHDPWSRASSWPPGGRSGVPSPANARTAPPRPSMTTAAAAPSKTDLRVIAGKSTFCSSACSPPCFTISPFPFSLRQL